MGQGAEPHHFVKGHELATLLQSDSTGCLLCPPKLRLHSMRLAWAGQRCNSVDPLHRVKAKAPDGCQWRETIRGFGFAWGQCGAALVAKVKTPHRTSRHGCHLGHLWVGLAL